MAIIKSVVVGSSLVFLAAAMMSGMAAGQPKHSYKDVEVLLKSKCFPCHDSKHHKEHVDVSNYKSLMSSGGRERVVIAGKPDKSNLLLYIDGTKKPMMPMGGKMLSAGEIKLVKDWIKAGAKP